MRIHNYLIFVLLCLVAAGCATYGELEEDYGKSYTAAKSGQILNPGASKNLNPVTGLSGKAAAASMDKYTESFGKPAEQPSKALAVPVMPYNPEM